jgi:FAD/FMN-containing dehydrogenase
VADALRAALAAVVGDAHVLADRELVAGYERDWTGRFGGEARLVVRPASTEEVAGVVRACADAGAAIVPQGGNTGLVGGGVPRGGEVVVSLARLDGLEAVDPLAAQVTAGAGVTLEALQGHARAAGLAFAVDYGARSAATVGGMVATNAGGMHVVRYGTMRAQVVGLEAVLADGSVISRLTGLIKDNAGYDLPSLLVGSEGTLGIVTRARLRLVPRLGERATALFAVEGAEAALELFAELRRHVGSLEAVELMFREGIELVEAEGFGSDPFDVPHPAYVLVECAARTDPMDELAEAVDALDVRDVAVASDSNQRAALWALREGLPEAINQRGVPHKLDVSVPLATLPAFADAVRERVAEGEVVLFGHVGDGNLHVNVLGLDPDDETVDQAVLELVAEHGGSVSAEHGIGIAKARWLSLTRSPEEIAAMHAIKRALDPAGLLNPGVLLAAG